VFVPPRFDVYRALSQQIRGIFARYTLLIEPLSLDEAYLDVTAPLLNQGSTSSRSVLIGSASPRAFAPLGRADPDNLLTERGVRGTYQTEHGLVCEVTCEGAGDAKLMVLDFDGSISTELALFDKKEE
jgi:nucleotidyltransferase/DNA polymerase involved in DNA repair